MTTIRRLFGMRLPLLVMIVMLALALAPAMVLAEGENEDPVNEVPESWEDSEFQNPTQFEKAVRVTKAAGLEDEDIKGLFSELKDAIYNRDELEEGDDDYDPEYWNGEVERIKEELGYAFGDIYADIEERRDKGEGWGEIVKSYDGLHPSILGNRYGHTKRDVKTGGWGKGHFKSASGKGEDYGQVKEKSGSKGYGYGKSKEKSNNRGRANSNRGEKSNNGRGNNKN